MGYTTAMIGETEYSGVSCAECSMPYDQCTTRVLNGRGACCSRCRSTDTHNEIKIEPTRLDEDLTRSVLNRVFEERERQVARYGHNDDLPDGTGPRVAWLQPLAAEPAEDVERIFRQDYEDFEEYSGHVTWSLLIREEVAEAFSESDPERLSAELLQVAALCVSWIESLEKRGALPMGDDPADMDGDESPLR